MQTYFILNATDGRLKVGRSINPARRMQGLQGAAGAALTLLGVLEGDRERELHDRLKPHRLKGEWFAWNADVRTQIRAWGLTGLPPIKEPRAPVTAGLADAVAVAESLVGGSFCGDHTRDDLYELATEMEMAAFEEDGEDSFEEWVAAYGPNPFVGLVDDMEEFVTTQCIGSARVPHHFGTEYCLLLDQPATPAMRDKLARRLVDIACWVDPYGAIAFSGFLWQGDAFACVASDVRNARGEFGIQDEAISAVTEEEMRSALERVSTAMARRQ